MTLSLSILDVTDRKEKGVELHNVIVKEAKRAFESKLYLPIPNLLMLTQDQYDDLSKDLNSSPIDNMYHSDDKMYVTPYSVMEVRVDKRIKLTFKEAHSLDDKEFEEWEESNNVGI